MSFKEVGLWGIPEIDSIHLNCLEGALLARAKISEKLGGPNPLSVQEEHEFCRKAVIFVDLAKTGFTLYKRAVDYSPSQIRDLLEKTSPLNYSILNNELTEMGYSEIGEALKILSASREGTAYKTFRWTLEKLSTRADVTFEDFTRTDTLNLGKAESKPSYWNFNLTPDFVWQTMHKVRETVIKTLSQKRSVDFEKLIQTGHFLTAASAFSRPKQS